MRRHPRIGRLALVLFFVSLVLLVARVGVDDDIDSEFIGNLFTGAVVGCFGVSTAFSVVLVSRRDSRTLSARVALSLCLGWWLYYALVFSRHRMMIP
jgi:predicted membrane channel-forming protein YqfA (hemolysin III family)